MGLDTRSVASESEHGPIGARTNGVHAHAAKVGPARTRGVREIAERRPPSHRAFQAVLLGLTVYAVLEIASAPFAWLTSNQWKVFLANDSVAAKATFHKLAGTFYMARAIADIGLALAFVAGLVWLYQAWARARTRTKKRMMTPAAVVVWSLLPFWGYWRLHGFLVELSRRNGLNDDVVKVGRWWWTLAAHVALRMMMATVRLPGWGHILDSLLAATAALFGMQMLRTFQRAEDERVKRTNE